MSPRPKKDPARKSRPSEKDYQEGLLRASLLGPDGWMDGLALAATIEEEEREFAEDLRRAPSVLQELDKQLKAHKQAKKKKKKKKKGGTR